MTKARTVPAGEFKQGCLAMIDQVAETKNEIVITKRGRPVARLVPMEDPREHERKVLAELRGQAALLADDAALLEPTSQWATWRALSEQDPEP